MAGALEETPVRRQLDDPLRLVHAQQLVDSFLPPSTCASTACAHSSIELPWPYNRGA
jgi:hypothetical protein